MCGPEDELERAELRNLLDQALASLREEQRLVLVLREIEGLDYEAIAAQLDVPIGTVRSRLNRARAALREEIERQAPALGDQSRDLGALREKASSRLKPAGRSA